jgi:hypothetical protein
MVFKISFKWFIHLSCENFQIKSIVSKRFLFSQPSFKKDFKKFIKFLPNWIQVLPLIHFPSLCCHSGISVPRVAIEIRSYLSINLPLFLSSVYSIYLSVPPHVSRSHLHMKHSRCPIHISHPYNQPIISGSAIHHFFPPSHPIVFKRSSIPRVWISNLNEIDRFGKFKPRHCGRGPHVSGPCHLGL